MQAIVCFEKEEDAKKLRGVKSLDVKGMPVNVVREKVLNFFCLYSSVPIYQYVSAIVWSKCL